MLRVSILIRKRSLNFCPKGYFIRRILVYLQVERGVVLCCAAAVAVAAADMVTLSVR